MDRLQNMRYVSSPPQNSPQEQFYSSIVAKRGLDGTRLFQDSVIRNQTKKSFGDISLAKSGFFSSSSLQDSMIKGIGRGLGSLPEDRLRKIAKDFITQYGNGNQISLKSLGRIQREAYEKVNNAPTLDNSSLNETLKAMDQNRDGRVTEQDIVSLCRRYLSCDKRPIAFTPMVEERLAVARRLFKQFDVDKKGYLTEKQVPNLLSQTYKSLGKSFLATEEDIKSWVNLILLQMKLADGDGDGLVTLQQYERSIIRALKKQGIKIYDQ